MSDIAKGFEAIFKGMESSFRQEALENQTEYAHDLLDKYTREKFSITDFIFHECDIKEMRDREYVQLDFLTTMFEVKDTKTLDLLFSKRVRDFIRRYLMSTEGSGMSADKERTILRSLFNHAVTGEVQTLKRYYNNDFPKEEDNIKNNGKETYWSVQSLSTTEEFINIFQAFNRNSTIYYNKAFIEQVQQMRQNKIGEK